MIKRKTNRKLLLLITAFQFIAFSCRDKMDLKLSFKKGETFKLLMKSDQKISQSVFGKPMDSNQSIEMGYGYEVLDHLASGDMKLKCSYESVKYSMESAMGKVEYDSTKKDQPKSPMTSAYGALVGNSFTLTITPRGEITELKGAKELVEKMMKDTDIPDEAMRAKIKEDFDKQFGEEQLKKQMENAMAIYPAKPVSIGDSWKKQVSMSMGFPLLIESKYTLKEIKGDRIILEMDSILKEDPKGEPFEMGPVKSTYKVSGSQKGLIKLSKANGFIVGSDLTQAFKGEILIEGSPNMPEGMSIPLEVNGKSTMETYK